ncbi:MAG: hypothetical protein R3F39_12510 [Myxococcota bacterium]
MTVRTLAALMLAVSVGAPGCDDGEVTTGDLDHFAGVVVAPDLAAMAGRILDFAGDPVAGIRVAACSDLECPFAETDAGGYFLHLDIPARPRRFEIFGQYDEFGSLAFRREFDPGELVNVGDVTLPRVQGPPAAWDPREAGTALIAGGRIELTVAPDKADGDGVRPKVLQYPLGTVRFDIQAGRVPGEQIPPFYNQPWVGKEADTLAFSVVPFDLFALKAVKFRVLEGVTKPEGTVYDIYDVDPLDGLLLPAGTATVDADGVLVGDKLSELRDLTFFMFVPQGD